MKLQCHKIIARLVFCEFAEFFVDLRESKCNGTSQIRQFFCRLTNFMSIKHHLIQKLQRHCGIMIWFLSWVWKHFLRRKMDFLWSKLAHPCLWSFIYMVIFGPKYRIEGVKTLNPSALLPTKVLIRHDLCCRDFFIQWQN